MIIKRPLKLHNSIQSYAWGSRDALEKLFGLANPTGQPQAEIWMGAHPVAPSLVEVDAQNRRPLNQLIDEQGERLLGQGVAERFGRQLPYLFKVLSAAEPLSIQAHPSREQARQGFEKENNQGIPVTAANRNYRDSNHKPELIYALTPFRAMNGFRPVAEIMAHFGRLDSPVLADGLKQLAGQPTAAGLKRFYGQLMQLDESRLAAVVTEALRVAESMPESTPDSAFAELVRLHDSYPLDRGVLSPLLLNLVTLKPGEAMFIDAGTLHAYLEGIGLEVMASSDNVLRGGLTPKHVDVAELLDIIDFTPKLPGQIRVTPVDQYAVYKSNVVSYPAPVDDFTFTVLQLTGNCPGFKPNSVELLFCQEGQVIVDNGTGDQVKLAPAEACLIPAGTGYSLHGQGTLARVGCCAGLNR